MSETENPFESRPRIFVVDVEVEIAKMELKAYKKIANIDDLVEKSGSANDAKRSKPHPDIFEATLKKLGLSHQQVLALGDTPYDAEAAGKAGIWTVGVTTGGWNKKELLGAGCIEVYTDVADLLEHFERSAFLTI